MGKKIITYLLHVVIVSAILLCGSTSSAARPVAKSESHKVLLDKITGLPNTEIEVVNQPVTATGQPVLQKNLVSPLSGVAQFTDQNRQDYKAKYGNRAAGLFRETHLSLIYPFHYFW